MGTNTKVELPTFFRWQLDRYLPRELYVDRNVYQRPIVPNHPAIVAAKEGKLHGFPPIIGNQRGRSRRLSVIDGGQRLEAHRIAHGEARHIDVLWTRGLSVEQEALLFDSINDFESPVGSFWKFRARRFYGDEVAAGVSEAVAAAGLETGPRLSLRSVNAIRRLEEMYEEDPEWVTLALVMLRHAFPEDAKAFTDAMLGSLLWTFKWARDEEVEINYERLTNVLAKIGPPDEIVSRARAKAAAAEKPYLYRLFAGTEIAEAYNRRLARAVQILPVAA